VELVEQAAEALAQETPTLVLLEPLILAVAEEVLMTKPLVLAEKA
jgi:hypothetical protein